MLLVTQHVNSEYDQSAAADGTFVDSDSSQEAEIASERWLTWDAWQAKQADRIFAEAHIARTSANATEHSREPGNVTRFQFLFFEQLRRLAANSETEFLDRVRQLDIPREAGERYWRAREAGQLLTRC